MTAIKIKAPPAWLPGLQTHPIEIPAALAPDRLAKVPPRPGRLRAHWSRWWQRQDEAEGLFRVVWGVGSWRRLPVLCELCSRD